MPVAASLNRIRPANVSEILAYSVPARQDIITPVATESASGSQLGFLDLTGRRRDEDADDEETAPPRSRRHRHTNAEPAPESTPRAMNDSNAVRITGVGLVDDAVPARNYDAVPARDAAPAHDDGPMISTASASALLAATPEEIQATGNWIAFWSERAPNKHQKLEKRGKLINYSKATEEVQVGLNESREVEWSKWIKHGAASVRTQEEAAKMRSAGAEEIGTQWIETDKNEHLRKPGEWNVVPPNLKSRLVALGNHEKHRVRSDSPTADNEALHLIASFAASNKVAICFGDMENAYFKGVLLTRKLLLRLPRGELPGVPEGSRLEAHVPIYGTRDAGRDFWQRLRQVLIATGMVENQILKATYMITVDGVLKGILASHVDDLLWAFVPDVEYIIEAIREQLQFGKSGAHNFRYCGREIDQCLESFSITIKCSDTTMKLVGLGTITGDDDDDATSTEKSEFGSIVGSLAWISRVCRLDLLANTSKLQQMKKRVTKKSLRECNKVVKYAREHADRGLTFKSGVIDWNNMVIISITDASWAEEVDPDTGEPHRSLGGRLTALATPSFLSDDAGYLHVISFSCAIIHRVCRATIQAETYQMTYGVEHMDHLRAAMASMFGDLDMRDWERTASMKLQAVLFTDCDSSVQALLRPVLGRITDKRLSIELAGLRQSIWRTRGDRIGISAIADELPTLENATDVVRWIDTDVMIADCLTKLMDATKLMESLNNYWSCKQPIESLMKKRTKQAQRRTAKTTKQEAQEAGRCARADDTVPVHSD